ncbi:MAG: rhodanese-like domain-containing protein [Ruminococcaceae bacterium]|nr:rhodanese-like domain-containing protein [Oscillospiraceae bacterium]
MGILDFFRGPDINEGVTEYAATPGAVLLDVRTVAEYEKGAIPGSRNLPLDRLGKVVEVVKDRDTPVFVYCLSGARSQQATAYLESLGYTRVKNIGGISRYRGKVGE